VPSTDPISSPEDWEEDFDFDAPAVASTKALFPIPQSRAGKPAPMTSNSVPSAALSTSERRELEKLLSTLPDWTFDESMLDSNNSKTDGRDKFDFKDLLRDIHATSKSFDRHIDQLALAAKAQDRTDAIEHPPGARESSTEGVGGVGGASGYRHRESQPLSGKELLQTLEQQLVAAVADKDVKGEVAACLELARTYRSMGQTGASMLKLQHAQALADDREKTPDIYQSCDGKEVITEAHVLHEVCVRVVL
jgi:hypothetical protein